MHAATLMFLLPFAVCAQTPDTHQHDFRDVAKWAQVFDAQERDEWQKPDEVIRALAIAPDAIVADIGAGTGYFTMRLSPAVPKGRVYAVDVETEMVKHLALRAAARGLANVIAVRGSPEDPRLPGKVDLVLLVDVYHHIEDREFYFSKVRGMLKPGGRLAVIDYKAGAPQGPPADALVSPETVKKELDVAGFLVAQEHDFLPRQFFLVFR